MLNYQFKSSDIVRRPQNLKKSHKFSRASLTHSSYSPRFVPVKKAGGDEAKKPQISNLEAILLNSDAVCFFHRNSKGQLVSKCPYEKSVSSKIPTKIFLGFLPWKFTTSRLVEKRVYLLAKRT